MHLWKESIWYKYSIALYHLLFMFNKWYVKWLSISYHYSLLTTLFKWFIFLIVYLFIIYLTHWKSITYQETIDCFSCFSCLQPFCENAWMMAFANFWFGGNLREWFEAKKFFCLWTWFYILYIRGTQALRQGPNFHTGKILKI